MNRRSMRLGLAGTALMVMIVAAGPSLAQGFASQSEDDRRVDRLEKQVRELRSIVFQGRDTGQPIVVKPAGPDPQVTALEQRLDQLDDAVRRIGGQLEVLTHDADEARQSSAAAREQNGELRGQLHDLADRVAKLEAAPPPPAPPPPPPPANLTGAVGASGLYGDPTGPTETGPPTAASAYKHARALLTAQDYAAASRAFQAFVSAYDTSALVPTAYYWLGESDAGRQAWTEAVPAYANALKGWPKSAWASDATVKLSRALLETNQGDQACAALAEFDRRYRRGATPAVTERANTLRSRAKCGG